MDRQVNWALAALGDLEAAADYIERDSPHDAASLVMEILAVGRSFSFLSHRGRQVPELADPQIGELVKRNWGRLVPSPCRHRPRHIMVPCSLCVG